MTLSEKLSIGIAVMITLGMTAHFHLTAGWIPTVVIGFVALGGGIILWSMTSLRYPTDPKLLLPPYLLTAGLLMFHIVEEYAFDFGNRIAGITEGLWTTEWFLWSLGLGFPIVWISGAIAIAKRHPFGGFVSWFVFIGMLLGEPTHLVVFPLREMFRHGVGYEYFPGMWTALLPLIPGIWGIAVVIADNRRQRAATREKSTPGTVRTSL